MSNVTYTLATQRVNKTYFVIIKRNILILEKNIVKISKFSLAEEKKKLPHQLQFLQNLLVQSLPAVT